MSWDAAMFGTLSMSAAQFKQWLEREASSAKVPDAEKYLSTLEVSGDKVKKALRPITKFKDTEGLGFIDVTQDPAAGTIELRSFLCKDDYLDHCVTLASIWAAGAPEATGELYFAGMLTASFCYRLTVGPKGVKLAKLAGSAADKLPTYQEIQEKVEARVAELGL